MSASAPAQSSERDTRQSTARQQAGAARQQQVAASRSRVVQNRVVSRSANAAAVHASFAATPAMAWGNQLGGEPIGGGTRILPVAMTTGLSCVPFARMATGIAISGDARLWWHNAANLYYRGQAPERGAVLAFMATGGMTRGHVAVVSRVLDDRTILIDHSNWGGPGVRRGTVMRGVQVMDVSDRNDWSAVRVQVGYSTEAFGRTYPTYGFIYNRPTGQRLLTAAASIGGDAEEVAEAYYPHAAAHMQLAAETLGR